MDVQESAARRISTRYMWWSMGVGLVPFPLVDMVAITGVQLRMLQRLSHNYGVPFYRGQGKKIISALLGSVIPTSLTYTVGSTLKAVPLLGPIIGGISMPIFAGATTYAIGKLFMQHFESGGTFLDLDPAKVREYFRQEFEKGQKLVSEMRSKATATEPPKEPDPPEPPRDSNLPEPPGAPDPTEPPSQRQIRGRLRTRSQPPRDPDLPEPPSSADLT